MGTPTHTNTQDNYCNPRRTCVPGVKNSNLAQNYRCQKYQPLTMAPQLLNCNDAKPLKLVGCFSPLAKKGFKCNLVLAGILAFYAVKTCSKHAL